MSVPVMILMIAIKYAVTLLDHMYATVTLVMNWDWMIELVLVSTRDNYLNLQS